MTLRWLPWQHLTFRSSLVINSMTSRVLTQCAHALPSATATLLLAPSPSPSGSLATAGGEHLLSCGVICVVTWLTTST